MAESQTIMLPNELWIRVLQNLDNDEDLPELWITCRHVCTAFKETAEIIFRDRHLPKTRLNFNFGEYTRGPSSRQLNEFTLTGDFEFLRLSDDKTTASFRLEDHKPKELVPPIKERMAAHIRNMDIAEPRHTIQIRRDIHDGPIPGLSFDQAKCELSCNWLDLFTAFYGEELLAHRLTDQWLDTKMAWLEELKAKMARGDMGAERVIKNAVLEFGSGEELNRKIARRFRIRHQFREFDGTDWDMERDGDMKKEQDAMMKLRILKQFASTEAFSDEEYSDEWEDENEDEDSGWGDEDDDSTDDE